MIFSLSSTKWRRGLGRGGGLFLAWGFMERGEISKSRFAKSYREDRFAATLERDGERGFMHCPPSDLDIPIGEELRSDVSLRAETRPFAGQRRRRVAVPRQLVQAPSNAEYCPGIPSQSYRLGLLR
jgi:hypothetical protein